MQVADGVDDQDARAAQRDPFAVSRGSWLARQIETESANRSGFALLPVGMIAGAAIVYGLTARPNFAALLTATALAFGALLLSRSGSMPRAFLAFALSVLLGLWLATFEVERTRTTIFSGEATVFVTARVVSRESDERGRERYVLDILSTERPVLSRPPERVRILVSSRHEPIPIGGEYRGLVRIRPPSGPARPGSHDFAFQPFFQGLGGYGFSLGAPLPATGTPPDPTFAERVQGMRGAISERIKAAMAPAEGAVGAALVTGERAGIPDEIEEALRVTGLSHVLSISGFHMALVAGFVMLSSRAIASLFPGLAVRVPTKKLAALAALAISSGYMLLAGDNVATQRSYLMLVVMLGAVLIDRPALTLRNVGISAVIVTAFNPHAAMTASFQMSFAATTALVGAYGAFVGWLAARRRGERTKRGLVVAGLVLLGGLALSSFIAGGATMPFGAYHFQRAAPYGLVANVLAMPLFSFWIMPLALAGTLLIPFGLDGIFFAGMGYGLTVVFEMAIFLAGLLPDQPTAAMTGLGLLLFAAAILALCLFTSGLRLLAVPLAVLAFAAAPVRTGHPELLVFEDGREIALVAEDGTLAHLKARPNGFVAEQWERSFGIREGTATPGRFACADAVCRATTRSGIRVAWTDDYEKTGVLCDSADVAIVARAIRTVSCRSGAALVTLRTLRRSGSLAVARSDDGLVEIREAVAEQPNEWNVHRLARWPEFWRKPADGEEGAAPAELQ